MPTAEQSDEALPQESSDRKKGHAKQVMSAEREDALIDWIRETPCLYQKGLREYRDTHKRSRLRAAEVESIDEAL